MPRRFVISLSLLLGMCGLVRAQTESERPGNARRSVNDGGDAAAELPASFFQLPNYGEPPATPKPETKPQPPAESPPPPLAAKPVPLPTPVVEPPAEELMPQEQTSSRRTIHQPKAFLEPPPAATLPPIQPLSSGAPLSPPPASETSFPPPVSVDTSPVMPVTHTQPLLPPTASAPLPLAPRSPDAPKALERPGGFAATPSVASIAGALAAVLGLFLVFAWATRKSMPQGMSRLPTEALEVLGRMPVHGKQEFQLVRIGNKLVLLAVSPMGMECVAEVDDPVEVERLCAMCKKSAPGSVTDSFREVLSQLGGESTRGGFAGEFARAAPNLRERSAR